MANGLLSMTQDNSILVDIISQVIITSGDILLNSFNIA
jgi:hypothetical protein